ncbi:nuclear distribution protein nudE-like 1 [Apostichopus japonicus]|uniref:nuclear distribution protein nudE-like 1 n=1 Tax=Stichopus japonicus TaxID=307972 RepID=UPI003AB65CA1
MDDEVPKFSSPEDEIKFWRNKAQQLKQTLDETKEELEEFQISSQELEQELETQLEQAEKKAKDFHAANQRLQLECETLKESLEQSQNQYLRQINELEDELAQIKAIKEELDKYIRELEQTNDDLERAKRTTVVSLEDFEHRLNLAIERNAFLENELDEKESLAVTVQRLKDEARDMRQELAVKDTDVLLPDKDVDGVIDNKVLEEKKLVLTPNRDVTGDVPLGHTPLTPSARISALNIVGDLLRKVGALENKLASCKNFVKERDQQQIPRKAISPIDSPRSAKRANRTGAVPSPGNLQGVVKITV